MNESSDFDTSQDWPADEVEQILPGVAEAEHYLAANLPDVLANIRKTNNDIIKLCGTGLAELPDAGYHASVMGIARMALRHGSMSSLNYYYHFEVHALDVLQHLLMLVTELSRRDDLEQLEPLACLCLTLFAATHDIRQTETGYGDDGAGHNERASADEARRVLLQIGLDEQSHQAIFQLLRWMIHGSTFFTRQMKFGGKTLPSGALAPIIAGQVLSAAAPVGPFSAAQAAELVLLATDIDTANVAEPIAHYAEQSVRMCREAHRNEDLSMHDHAVSRSVLDFLTGNQEQYFFKWQRFYSRLALMAFADAKNQTGKLLRELTAWMQMRYAAKADQSGNLPSGDELLQAFMDQATELGRQHQ